MNGRGRGFTLLELLVVITILAILMTLAVSGFEGAQRAVYRTRCQNNLNQLAKIILAYCEMHDGFFPPPCTAAGFSGGYYPGSRGWLFGGGTTASTWRVDEGLLMKLKMVGDPEIFLCPLHADEYSVYRPEATAVYWKTDHTSHKQNSRFWGSYMMNARTWTTNNEPRRREDFSSNHFLLVEEHEMDSQFNDGAIEPIAQDKIATRHEGKGYIACMDGHVIEMTSTEFDATKSDVSKYWEP